MNRRRLALGLGAVALVALFSFGAHWVLSIGDCGIGNAQVYPVVETNGSVESPSDARGTVVAAFHRNLSRPYNLSTFVGNRSVFNREYVYRASVDDEVRRGIADRSSMVDEGERFYLFSSGARDDAVGVSEAGEVFVFEAGIC